MLPASYSADRRCASTIHCSLGHGHSVDGRFSHNASINRIWSAAGKALAAWNTSVNVAMSHHRFIPKGMRKISSNNLYY